MPLTKADIWRRVAGLLSLVLAPDEPWDGDRDYILLLLDDLGHFDLPLPPGATPQQAADVCFFAAEERITLVIGAFTAAFARLAQLYDEGDTDMSSLEAVRAMALEWAGRDG
jgi:hypothetical protein